MRARVSKRHEKEWSKSGDYGERRKNYGTQRKKKVPTLAQKSGAMVENTEKGEVYYGSQ